MRMRYTHHFSLFSIFAPIALPCFYKTKKNIRHFLLLSFHLYSPRCCCLNYTSICQRPTYLSYRISQPPKLSTSKQLASNAESAKRIRSHKLSSALLAFAACMHSIQATNALIYGCYLYSLSRLPKSTDWNCCNQSTYCTCSPSQQHARLIGNATATVVI